MLERAARLETQALGGVVLMIVLAILLPIIEINQLVR
jgi:type II secretory pathway component PulF